jgi:hypothetical protein
MPFYHRVYTPGQLQFITASTYRRTPLFHSDRFRHCFVQRLEDESHCRLWQRRFYPFHVFSEHKFHEKFDYMHNSPVTRGLVSAPGDWPWSSWRFYFWEDASILRMDRMH